jgi:hypothetical protein
MIAAGYSPTTAVNPKKNLISQPGFQELLEQHLPDSLLIDTHSNLLKSTKIEHMVFPLGPKDEDDPNFSGSNPNAKNPLDDLDKPVERTSLTDKEITAMLAEVNCTVKRIVHGQSARHVYFWVPNTKAQQDALKLAYDVKGKLESKDVPPSGNTFNITQNNLNPNTPEARNIVDSTVEFMMEQTKRIKEPTNAPTEPTPPGS